MKDEYVLYHACDWYDLRIHSCTQTFESFLNEVLLNPEGIESGPGVGPPALLHERAQQGEKLQQGGGRRREGGREGGRGKGKGEREREEEKGKRRL